MQRRGRPLPPRADSDSEEESEEVGRSDTEASEDEDEARVVPLGRRRGGREEDEGEEGGPLSEDGESEDEEDDDEEEYTSDYDSQEDDVEEDEAPGSSSKRVAGPKADDASSSIAKAVPVQAVVPAGPRAGQAGRGRGARQGVGSPSAAQQRRTRAAGPSAAKKGRPVKGGTTKLVYRPKNAAAAAGTAPPSTESADACAPAAAIAAGQEPAEPEGQARPAKGPARKREARRTRDDAEQSAQDEEALSEEEEDGEAVVGEGEGGEEAAAGKGRGRGRGKVDPNDPQFVPRGRFFMHDDRFGGRGGAHQRARPDDSYDPDQEQIWTHDGYERLEREEREGRSKKNNKQRLRKQGQGRGAPPDGTVVAQANGGTETTPVKKVKGQRHPGGRGNHYQPVNADQGTADQTNMGGSPAYHNQVPVSAGAPKRYSSQRVATTDETSLTAKAVAAAAAVNAATAPVPGAPYVGFPGVVPTAASSPIRPNARPFRPKGNGMVYMPVGYAPFPPDYAAGAPFYPPPAFPAYGFTQGQFPAPPNYLADPAIIDSSGPSYPLAPSVELGPDPTMMSSQITPYGAYPPPFFYSAPVYPAYGPPMDVTGNGSAGRGRGRGHPVPFPPQSTIFYPPQENGEEYDASVESEQTYDGEQEQQFYDGNQYADAPEEVPQITNGDLPTQHQPQPNHTTASPPPTTVSSKVYGSKLRAKAPKWVPKGSAVKITTPTTETTTTAS